MRRVAQLLLIPFWVLGFVAAVVVVVVVAVAFTTADGFRQVRGSTHV